jgi:UrcA family protein
MKMKLLIAAAVAATLPTIGTAQARRAPEASAVSAIVFYADLDLATEDGRAVLDARIRAQAERVCRRELSGSVWLPQGIRACVSDAVAQARPKAASAIEYAERAARASGLAVR